LSAVGGSCKIDEARDLSSSVFHASDGAAYEVLLGRWANLLAKVFLDFVDFPATSELLDLAWQWPNGGLNEASSLSIWPRPA
jgi:hypothetical protein